MIVQDPRWEQSFPAISGLALPLADPGVRLRPVRLTRREAAAAARRTSGGSRLSSGRSPSSGSTRSSLASEEPAEVFASFVRWHERRRERMRLR